MIGSGLRISVSSRSASVTVTARDGVGPDARHAHRRDLPDGSIVFEAEHGGSKTVELVCPTGSHVTVGTASGSVELTGHFGTVRIVSASGHVEVGHVEGVDVRTASGRVEVERCDGECRIVTKSGRVQVGHASSADIATVSGRIEAGVSDSAAIKSVSGTVSIGATGPHPEVRVRTVSGKVEVEVGKAVTPALLLRSLSGRARPGFDSGADGTVAVETISGSIQVRRR